jgi:hypothetical protein
VISEFPRLPLPDSIGSEEIQNVSPRPLLNKYLSVAKIEIGRQLS